jgi:hypothetical protein
VAVEPLPAHLAAAAVVSYLGGDRFAHVEESGVRARLDDLSGELVTGDRWEPRVRRVVHIPVVVCLDHRDVATTDPGVLHANEDLFCRRLGSLAVLDSQYRVFPDLGRVHRSVTLSLVVRQVVVRARTPLRVEFKCSHR